MDVLTGCAQYTRTERVDLCTQGACSFIIDQGYKDVRILMRSLIASNHEVFVFKRGIHAVVAMMSRANKERRKAKERK